MPPKTDLKDKNKDAVASGSNVDATANPTFSCPLCTNCDNVKMVQCDKCDVWFHFKCVNVTSSIKDHDWLCERCRIPPPPSGNSSAPSLNLALEFNPNNSAEPLTSTEYVKIASQMPPNPDLPRIMEETKSMHSKSSKLSSRKRRELALQRLEEERALQEKLNKEFLDKKYRLLESELGSSDELEENITGDDEANRKQQEQRIQDWVNKVKANEQPRENHRNPEQQKNVKNPRIASPKPLPIPETSQQRTPNKCQLAARHIMPKELPTFYGSAEEWPLFISNFESSTSTGGFSNEENLLRLQRCLKGKALESVRSLLLLPSCVPDVIATLRMLFGRPEVIIHSILQKLRSEPSPKAEKLDTLIKFALSVRNLCASMLASGLSAHLCNPVLLQELVDKLPAQLKLNWAMYQQAVDVITLSTFDSWLMKIAQAASQVTLTVASTSSEAKPEKRLTKDSGYLHAHRDDTQDSSRNFNKMSSHKSARICQVCGGACVSLAQCSKFINMNHSDKWNAIKQYKLCRKCLSSHGSYRCKSQEICGRNNCVFKHHRLLHNDKKDQVENNSSEDTGIVSTVYSNNQESCSPILFRIIPVILKGEFSTVHTFAFLDDGSSLTMIDQEIADELNLKGEPSSLCLKWTADMHRREENSRKVNLEISGTFPNSRKFTIYNARTVKSLDLPVQSIASERLAEKYAHLKGIPFESYANAIPRILIGLNNWKLGIPLKVREGHGNEPVATKSRLGWSVYGPCNVINMGTTAIFQNVHSFDICECGNLLDNNLQQQVKDYITLDNLGVVKSNKCTESVEDQRAMSILETTTCFKNSRYETGLLWRYDQINFPDSYHMALNRLICLEKRISRDAELAANLNKQIAEYVEKGYAKKLSSVELKIAHPRIWYLPTFPVINVNKPGKVRIVWDAAAKVDNISLNSMLLTGPDLLSSLPGVLYRFREGNIGISADIREMFHQIRIQETDQHSQRFLWRKDTGSEPDVYAMRVMTFGATCSPSCAQYIKNKNAANFTNTHPRAALAITRNHYVDDLLDSVHTKEEAIELAKTVKMIHKRGGFEIRNWISNSPEVVEALGEAPQPDKKSLNLSSSSVCAEKVLGMWWDTRTDAFMFSFSGRKWNQELLSGMIKPTKRDVLRTLMSIFDPLGIIAHYLIYLKILLQDVWRSHIEWDEVLNENQFEKWIKWTSLLPVLEQIHIPRCHFDEVDCNIQLHMFVDASENAYAAVAYLRAVIGTHVRCSLLGAKTRVAPLKIMSIPRLELQAAVLGARFASTLRHEHSIAIASTHFWSDSNTVISWLNSEQRNYRQFVAFRVGEILELSDTKQWRWIPSKQNVADEATKWQKNPSLTFSSRWFMGPEFLTDTENLWPGIPCQSLTEEELVYPLNFVQEALYPVCPLDISRFSNWRKLLRTNVFICRFLHNSSIRPRNPTKRYGPITQVEYMEAKNKLFQQAQFDCFYEEVAILKRNKSLSSDKQLNVAQSSSLLQLNPYLDENGVMRSCSRITAMQGVDDYTMRPIILPRKHHITTLLIKSYHLKFHHLNNETVVNEIRQVFSIYRLRVALKSIIKNCQTCKIRNAQPCPPQMAALPSARLAAFTRPFSYVGIDYFGPMNVVVGRRVEKRWGVLVTCLTTRAVHIEIAHSLSTSSCILCLRNCISRRGVPLEIYSDNGTNFHGTNNELKAVWSEIDRNKLMEEFCTENTKWFFNPPLSPHMGGSWERLVGSIKKILQQIQPIRNPTDEILQSLLIEIESIINSRPLTYIPLDDENSEALTPNHFLLGCSSGSKPLGQFTDEAAVLKKNWMTTQQLANSFWKRWVREYLPNLTRRNKWFHKIKPIEPGDIVLIVDPNSPRNCWPKGRILQTIPGKDGQVRRVTVQSKSGVYERPAVNIAVLDVGSKDLGKPSPEIVIPGGSITKPT